MEGLPPRSAKARIMLQRQDGFELALTSRSLEVQESAKSRLEFQSLSDPQSERNSLFSFVSTLYRAQRRHGLPRARETR